MDRIAGARLGIIRVNALVYAHIRKLRGCVMGSWTNGTESLYRYARDEVGMAAFSKLTRINVFTQIRGEEWL